MKITHLTSAHSRYDSRIFQKECCSLSKAGHSVSLLVADGLGNEVVNGVTIVSTDRKRSRLGRLLLTPFKIFLAAMRLKADVYHFHDPELILIGLLLKMFRKTVVYDIHENVGLQLSTRQWVPLFMRNPLGWFVDVFEAMACRFFDATVVPQPSMREKFQLYSASYLVANFVDLQEQPNNKAAHDEKTFVIFHAGGLTENRGLFSMLDVAYKLERAQLVLAGRFENAETENRARNHPGWERVHYLGVISKEEAEEWYAKTDLGLILYHNVGQYYLAYAIKLFEYMERAIPVIMPDFGDWVGFCEENRCGECVDVHNSLGVVGTIENLQSNPSLMLDYGRAGRQAIEAKYNWSFAERELLKLYKEVV